MSKLLKVFEDKGEVFEAYTLKFFCDKETKEALEFLKKNFQKDRKFDAAIRAIFDGSELKKTVKTLKEKAEELKKDEGNE